MFLLVCCVSNDSFVLIQVLGTRKLMLVTYEEFEQVNEMSYFVYSGHK